MLLHEGILFRESLARRLSSEADLELVAECANVAEALDRLVDSQPDVILFDLDLERDFVSTAREKGFQGKFLAMGQKVDAARLARTIRHGASGVFLSSDSPTRLVHAIHIVMSGGAWVDRDIVQLLAERYPQHEDVRLESLAEREKAVLRGILSGLTNRKIAAQIATSEATVKATLQRLFNKTGVRTRSQLVRIVLADPSAFSLHARAEPGSTNNPAIP